MDEAEQAAEVVIEAVLPGARMRFRSEEKQSGEETHDFDLSLPDGRRGAVEATQARDQDLSRVDAQLTDLRYWIPAEPCEHSWVLDANEGTDVRAVEDGAAAYLAKLEAEGWTEFHRTNTRRSNADRVLVEEMGLGGGSAVSRSDEPVMWFLFGPSKGSIVTGALVAGAARRVAMKKDNQEKLDRATADECHLFVLIHHHEGRGAWGSMLKSDPPDESPELPASIDYLWVALDRPGADGYLVWRRGQETGWTNLGVVAAG